MKRRNCRWQAPFEENETCRERATWRIGYRDETRSKTYPLVVPETELCDKHRTQLRRGVERNYGAKGTWTETAIPQPKPKKAKAPAQVQQ